MIGGFVVRRRSRIVALVVWLVLLGAACGGGPDVADQGSTGAAGDAAAVGDAAAGGDGADLGSVGDGGPASESADRVTAVGDGDRGGVGGDEAVPAMAEAPDGYVVWVNDEEPPHLHQDELDTPITAWIRQGLLEGLYGVDTTVSYYPELLAADAEVAEDGDGGRVRISYRLRSGLTWSDGEPLTAADVAYTYRILTEGCRREADGSTVDGDDTGCVYQARSRLGYDRIVAFEVGSDTEFTVTFSAFFPGWRDLFSQVMAEHAFGDDAAVVNDRLQSFAGPDGPLPSSGPLAMEGWDRGSMMVLAANDAYHGSVSPDAVNNGAMTVAGVALVFVDGPDAMAEALASGRADVMVTELQPALVAVAEAPTVTVAATPGADYEHWGLNLLNPHLASSAVRRAIVAAVDKPALIDELYRPLLGDRALPAPLGNTYWVANQPPYEDHQDSAASADPDAARALLEGDGYQRQSDGFYVHPDRGRLRLRSTTTSQDELRVAQQALLIEQLERAGIEVVADNEPAGRFFSQGPFADEALAASASQGSRGDAGRWDIAQFGWASGPWPGGQSGVYRSGSSFNPYGFADPTFDTKANECDTTVDDGGRNACYNELDRFVTTAGEGDGGLFMIPLVQRPLFYAYRSDRLASAPSSPGVDDGGPLVNAGDFVWAE